MWLFEVDDALRAGFAVDVRPGIAGVQLGADDVSGGPAILPLGRSLARLLEVTEDWVNKEVRLLHAHLRDTTSGLCLTRQTRDEAQADNQALVLISRYQKAPPWSLLRVAPAWGYSAPELVTHTESAGERRELYVFRPGDGLHICQVMYEGEPPKRFIVAWDGSGSQGLKELPEQPSRRRRRPRARRHSEAQELQPRPPQDHPHLQLVV